MVQSGGLSSVVRRIIRSSSFGVTPFCFGRGGSGVGAAFGAAVGSSAGDACDEGFGSYFGAGFGSPLAA
ncbi:MAG TPA: hypothetical protein VFS75_03820, partial [Candidatus Paceibacterota bacterium]|nr:hypothetical protein [Candidatus Paceibacterota bacterium]